MGLTTTPNLLRYPVRADTPDVPRDVQRLAEDTELALSNYAGLPFFGKPYIASGGAMSNPGGLFVAVAAGVAMINGWRFPFLASGNLALVASTTNHIWLKQTYVGGRHTGYTWVVKQTTALEADGVYVGQVVTGGAAITTFDASYRGIIAPGKIMSNLQLTAGASGIATGTVIATKDMVGDGVTPLLAEFYTNAFANSSGAGVNYSLYLRVAGVNVGAADYHTSGANYQRVGHVVADSTLAAMTWVGKKTVDVQIVAGGGTSSFAAAAGIPAWLRARADF